MRANSHTWTALGALLAAATLLATGCSASGSTPGPTSTASSSTAAATPQPATSPSPSPSSTFGNTGDPIDDAYEQFWLGFLNAQTLGDPTYRDMTRRATGQALAWAQEVVRAYVANGWVRSVKPGFALHERVTSRSEQQARVTDVQDWTLWPLVVRSTGQQVPNSTPRQCITADLTRQDGTWLVTTLVFTQSGC
ncbi:hypothetical protein [Frankia sp. QA3]|uniref:hypothetical protein n=1 Tax=Frankia sp. QA3 TaxID=710111 RepID=UPI000269BD19|nr:hypothetical protein [Frankia sp. QA3]EIV91356.1 hypothetical protein FraQA3DRAFT_0797 [Frankia sp. QA3]